MFSKPTLLLVGLVLSAAPIWLAAASSGTNIEFKKRSIKNPSGVFDYDAYLRQVARDVNKHRRNLINIKRNFGEEGWNEGAKILPPRTYILPRITKRQSEDLTEENNNDFWVGKITVGTPPQPFSIDFDTGSSDLWVAGANCTGALCSNKKQYDPTKSSTSVLLPGNFSITYADKSTVSGLIFNDTVTVAGITAKDQTFSAVDTLSNAFKDGNLDGIMGMALPGNSVLNTKPFFYTAKAQGAVSEGIFAFKLTNSTSNLHLGGVNTSLFTGGLEFHAINSNKLWQIPGASVLVKNSAVVSNVSTVIDSGTTIILGPPAQVQQFYKAFPGAAVADPTNGLYTYPCKSYPGVAFSWGGKNFTISSDNFSMGTVQDDPSQCVGTVVGIDVGLGNNVWLLGDSFMMNVYTAFSTDNNTVGFADLK